MSVWGALFLLSFISLCRIGNSQVLPLRDNGGGYQAFEADYLWREIADLGEPLVGIGDNEVQGPFAIGFDFPFFGQLYSEFWVSANGLIGFGPTDGLENSENTSLPDSSAPNNIIALYWKDLNPAIHWGGGRIYRYLWNGQLIVEFYRVAEQNPRGRSPHHTITMQAILKPNGDIILQYREVGVDFDLGVGTVGIEGPSGHQGVTVRRDGEGWEIGSGVAILFSTYGAGRFLIWDAGEITTSGDSQAVALRRLGFSVDHLKLRLNQPLPQDLSRYEAVFVNLGNFGVDGAHYHPLTPAEGRILDQYLLRGGSIYLEGGDTWARDEPTDVHPRFHIRGVSDGGPLSPPVVGVEGSWGEGLTFGQYEAEDNSFVDHLEPEEGAEAVFTFVDRGRQAIGMVSYLNPDYRTIGASFEFGALVDGEGGSKQELMRRIIEFFRTPRPQFPPPLNLRAIPGDGEVTLRWDPPRPGGEFLLEAERMRREINRLRSPRPVRKPNPEDRARIAWLQSRLDSLELLSPFPGRDELFVYQVFLNGELYDVTNMTQYGVGELRNGERYSFGVRAVYRDPDGVSEMAGPVYATPRGILSVGFETDFEENDGGLAPEPAIGGWEWGEPVLGAASGRRAWGTLLRQPYPDNATYILTLPPIDIRARGRPIFEFRHFYDCEPGWDGGRVEISTDGGERWQPITPVGGYPEAAVFALNEQSGYSGRSNGWVTAQFDLSTFVGQIVRVRLVFRSDESNFRPYPGWFIDDVKIPRLGDLTVNVRRADDGVAIPGAQVILGERWTSTTEVTGQAFFFGVPAGRYQLRVIKAGFVTVEREVEVVADERRDANVALEYYDSRLVIEPQEISHELDFGEEADVEVRVRNEGTMTAHYRIWVDFNAGNRGGRVARETGREGGVRSESLEREPDRDDPWDLIEVIDLTRASGEQYFYGAHMIATGSPSDYLYITTAGDFGSGQCRFYWFNRQGQLVRQTSQPFGATGWGVRDLAYDEDWVYGAYDSQLVKFNPATGARVATMFRSPLILCRAVAFSSEDGAFWMGNMDEAWYLVDPAGGVIDRWAGHNLQGVMGMAWNPDDPQGMKLYIHNQESPQGGAAIYRFNPLTRQLVRQLETATPEEGYPGGLFITYLYDTQTWTLGAVIQGPRGDKIKLYQLHPRSTWVRITPILGQLPPDSTQRLNVHFNGSFFLEGWREAVAGIYDLDRLEVRYLPLSLTVNGGPAEVRGVIRPDRPTNLRDAVVTLNRFTQRPDTNGFFRFSGLFPGHYLLQVSLAGFRLFRTEFDLMADELREVEINLEHLPYGEIRGRTTSIYDGSPMGGVEVVARGEDGLWRSDTTDGDGQYSLSLPAGVYEVRARITGWRAAPVRDVEVEDGDEVEVNFEMDDRLAVRSVFTRGDYDDRIIVEWLPPGQVRREIVLNYDSDVLANGLYLRNRDDIVAVKFQPPGICDVTEINIYIVDPRDFNNARWPDNFYSPFYLGIFLIDPETGLPGELVWQQVVDLHIVRRLSRWISIPVSGVRFLNQPFFVGFYGREQNPDDVEAIGLDEQFNQQGSVYLRLDRRWVRFDGLPGDPHIRVRIALLQEDEGDQDERMIGRAFREVSPPVGNTLPDRIVLGGDLLQHWEPQDITLNDQSAHHWREVPRRDPPISYRVLVNGEVAAEDIRELSWVHIVGTENENRLYRYRVQAIYADSTALESDEVNGSANSPPNPPTNVRVTVDSLIYTISWRPPTLNRDGSVCRDYAGCEIYLGNELMATIRAPDTLYQGQIQPGEEGWKTFRLVAFDEVPNRSSPAEVSTPLGYNFFFNFETATPVFTASPAGGGWERSRSLGNLLDNTGPQYANSGSYAWGTRPGQGRYLDNAQWSITTVNEYQVMSRGARVEFYHWFLCEQGRDGGQLQVSVDGGPWQVLEPVGGYPDERVAAFGNGPAWTGRSGGWQFVQADLSPYEGRAVRLRWLFRSDDTDSWYPGWFIDDLTLWGVRLPRVGILYGWVRDQLGSPVAQALISAPRGSTYTNLNGYFRLPNLLAGRNQISISKLGYISTQEIITIVPNDSIRTDFTLIKPLLTMTPDSWDIALHAGDNVTVPLRLSNNSDFEIRWWAHLRPFLADRDQVVRVLRRADVPSSHSGRDEPWEAIKEVNLTRDLGLSRVSGCEFDGEYFYLSANDPARGYIIAVLDRYGRWVNSFRQPLPRYVGWGLRDLAWDGFSLYGSQDSLIHILSPDGRLVGTFRGAPLTVNRALAYDPENDGFWCGEWDQPWYLINREGRVLTRWDNHGLRGVYGFAYHPRDEEGMFLYVANLEADGSTGIYRSNPRAGSIELVHRLQGPPAGLFFTDQWDFGREILGLIEGEEDQRLVLLDLGRRPLWVGLSPNQGIMEGGQREELQLTFTIPDAAQLQDRFLASLELWALGAAQLSVPIEVSVVAGFQHFRPPLVSDEMMTIHILEATRGDEPLFITSEVAAITPRGAIGGLVRWMGEETTIELYHHDGAFQPDDSIAFRVWDSRSGEEYPAVAQYVEGENRFEVGSEAVVRLSVDLPHRQVIGLARGWNLISSFIQPQNRDPREIFRLLVEREQLLFIKDGIGRFWAVERNFSNLGEWNPLNGYLVKVRGADSLIFTGERVPSETPIPLRSGWNQIAYLLDRPVSTRVALEGILDDLLIVKDGWGRFAVPRLNFWGLAAMIPGQGYQLKMAQPRQLTYRDQNEEIASLSSQMEVFLPPTGSNMSLLITSKDQARRGDFIAEVRTGVGKLVGWGKGPFPLGVAVWGDDITTDEVEGAIEGEDLHIIIRSPEETVTQQEYAITFLMNDTGDGFIEKDGEGNSDKLVFQNGALVLITLNSGELPRDWKGEGFYPNPFNGKATLFLYNPVRSDWEIGIYDLNGRLVTKRRLADLAVGVYKETFDLSSEPSGIYIISVEGPLGKNITKAVLMR